jgi:hypothetical protein
MTDVELAAVKTLVGDDQFASLNALLLCSGFGATPASIRYLSITSSECRVAPLTIDGQDKPPLGWIAGYQSRSSVTSEAEAFRSFEAEWSGTQLPSDLILRSHEVVFLLEELLHNDGHELPPGHLVALAFESVVEVIQTICAPNWQGETYLSGWLRFIALHVRIILHSYPPLPFGSICLTIMTEIQVPHISYIIDIK